MEFLEECQHLEAMRREPIELINFAGERVGRPHRILWHVVPGVRQRPLSELGCPFSACVHLVSSDKTSIQYE